MKTSTEAQTVAIDDTMGPILWTQLFLARQAHYLLRTSSYQYNKSKILLEENPKVWRNKSTQNLNVRHFL